MVTRRSFSLPPIPRTSIFPRIVPNWGNFAASGKLCNGSLCFSHRHMGALLPIGQIVPKLRAVQPSRPLPSPFCQQFSGGKNDSKTSILKALLRDFAMTAFLPPKSAELLDTTRSLRSQSRTSFPFLKLPPGFTHPHRQTSVIIAKNPVLPSIFGR